MKTRVWSLFVHDPKALVMSRYNIGSWFRDGTVA